MNYRPLYISKEYIDKERETLNTHMNTIVERMIKSVCEYKEKILQAIIGDEKPESFIGRLVITNSPNDSITEYVNLDGKLIGIFHCSLYDCVYQHFFVVMRDCPSDIAWRIEQVKGDLR